MVFRKLVSWGRFAFIGGFQMGYDNDDYVEVCGEVQAVTNKAVLLAMGTGECWIPKSVIEEPEELDQIGIMATVNVKEWFVEKEGIW